MSNPTSLGLFEQANLLEKKEISSSELTELYLKNINASLCDEAEWRNVAGEDGHFTNTDPKKILYCSLTATDTNTTDDSPGYKCAVRKSTETNQWQVRAPMSCTQVSCMYINLCFT